MSQTRHGLFQARLGASGFYTLFLLAQIGNDDRKVHETWWPFPACALAGGPPKTLPMSARLEPVLYTFSALLGVAVARTLPSLVAFYANFRTSGLEMATKRGYGQSACKAFGAHASARTRGAHARARTLA